MYQTNLCKKPCWRHSFKVFSKTWFIVTHAETASFTLDDVIRIWSFDSEMGSDRRLTLWNPEPELKALWKIISILQSNNLLIPQCPRNTISAKIFVAKATDENLIRKWVLNCRGIRDILPSVWRFNETPVEILHLANNNLYFNHMGIHMTRRDHGPQTNNIN